MEFFDPFGESTTNTTNKEMLKSRRASEASLFSTGSASSWNDFFSGTNTKKVQPKKRKPVKMIAINEKINGRENGKTSKIEKQLLRKQRKWKTSKKKTSKEGKQLGGKPVK